MHHPQIKDSEMKIYFAKELGYYPLKWITSFHQNGVSGIWQMSVTEYRTFEVDFQKFIFPTLVKVETSGPEKEGIMKLTLNFYLDETLTPLQINPTLDDDLFTISPSLAKTVTDYDAEIESGRVKPSTDIADDGTLIDYMPLKKSQWNTTRVAFLIMANVLLLALILFSFFRSRRNRQNEKEQNTNTNEQ
jgi:hypothetical protein